jgi:hypothetical protein
MTGAERFRVNSPKVTHETVDDEVVIINLDSGSYYSMSGIGAAIWSLIDSGASIDEAAAHAAGRYAGEAESIRAGLIALVKELHGEALIVADANRTPEPVAATESVDGDRPAFVAPTLQKFTDMQDLLLLDPIHDVTEDGWPHKE